ncbi:Hypothetical_protein [Hexamita inflata]|uniref:Hypothetical_protein n=1 Tax=Hexamita inflata TaxID=28002 RepID=A0AA86RHB4_9EUKA|nr:Hypothetical protein HINF_LOCUS7340 [Hexamita inflata]CAI9972109.1 Hypothetical protein HINF_LOCUS59754 [Hexamita inflata]
MNLKQNNTPYICNLRASYSNQQQYVNQSEKNNLHRLNKMMNNLGRKKEIVKEIETEVQIIHKKVQSSIKVTENQLGYVNMQLQQIILPKAKLLNKSNSKIFDVEQKLKHGLTADQQKQIYDDIHVRNVQRNQSQPIDDKNHQKTLQRDRDDDKLQRHICVDAIALEWIIQITVRYMQIHIIYMLIYQFTHAFVNKYTVFQQLYYKRQYYTFKDVK